MSTSVSVFCAETVPNPSYRQLAYETGRVLAQQGCVLNSAAGFGMMDAVCKGAFEAGGEVRGLRIAKENDTPSKFLSSVTYYPDFATRHEALVKAGQAFVVLPGGIGTLVEALTITQLKRFGELPFTAPLVFVGEYYRDLDALLQRYATEGFVKDRLSDLYTFVERPGDLTL
ncbi:MAG: LOG family protein [bacterium]|nr:LOG family protein [bacterium]